MADGQNISTDDVNKDDAPDFTPEAETLAGDVRDFFLGRIRMMQKPWEAMSEAEQTDLANAADLASREVVRKMVRVLNDFAFPHTVVELGEVKIGGNKGIEAKITASNIEHNRTVLGEHVGDQIIVLMCDSEQFMSARSSVPIDKDQPELPVDGEDA